MILRQFFSRLTRVQTKKNDDYLELPLLPLSAVLFPHGVMTVNVFGHELQTALTQNWRQDTFLAVGLKQNEPTSLDQKDKRQAIHSMGVIARITDLVPDSANQTITLILRGNERFVLLDIFKKEAILQASVKRLKAPARTVISGYLQQIVPLLHQIVIDQGAQKIPPPHDYGDASWVGYRLSEFLPIQALARQKLLELDDPLERLEIIYRYMQERGLLATAQNQKK